MTIVNNSCSGEHPLIIKIAINRQDSRPNLKPGFGSTGHRGRVPGVVLRQVGEWPKAGGKSGRKGEHGVQTPLENLHAHLDRGMH